MIDNYTAPERKPYPRTVKPRGKPRTQETPCPTCGTLMWLKADYGDRRRMLCPSCRAYFTVYPDFVRAASEAYANEGTAAWQALSNAAPDDLEWTGSVAALLAEIDAMERAERAAAWDRYRNMKGI